MTVPKHVMWFQVLLYLSLVLDAVSVAFQDRTPTAGITETTILAANVIAACMILLFMYLVWLAAHGRKSWPRWVLTAALGFSVLSLLQVISAGGLQLDSAIEVVSCALTAAGLCASFTGDAKGWFNA
jgi:protein-S-isoprenylcysteine O-methyltransferase Ste14